MAPALPVIEFDSINHSVKFKLLRSFRRLSFHRLSSDARAVNERVMDCVHTKLETNKHFNLPQKTGFELNVDVIKRFSMKCISWQNISGF